MKKFLIMTLAIFFLNFAQASAQEVYLGKNEFGDCYLPLETISYSTDGKDMFFYCSIRYESGNSSGYLYYGFWFNSEGYVWYRESHEGPGTAGIFNVTEAPPASSDSDYIPYRAFLVILRYYGLI